MAWFQRGSGELHRRGGVTLLLAILTGCAATGSPGPGPAIHAAPTVAAPIAAVLAAGDSSIPAFDNAIDYLRDLLQERKVVGDSTRLLSAQRLRPADEELSALPTLAARLQATKPMAGGSCLVYLTSHGGRDQGLWLSASKSSLTPTDLDRALELGCGSAPTVVVVSACFSGQFAAPPMTRPNRIILTAARSDRSSFGCGAGFTYTYFDECLIGALPNAADWHEIYARAQGCVAQRERNVNAAASEPQAYFGEAVRDLAAPLLPRGDTGKIQFSPAPTPFRPNLVPIDRAARQREAETLNAYLEAPPPKALALTPAGLLAVGVQDQSGLAGSGDVARLALQRCELISGGACILFARDGAMTDLLPSGQAPFHPLLLTRGGALDPRLTPFIRDDQRPQIAEYLASPDPKALALSPGHAELGIGTGATIEAARRDALDRCQAGVRDCLIYAEGGRIVLGWPQ
ncbi:MAG: C13 family peptidase [Aliidongia sp.]